MRNFLFSTLIITTFLSCNTKNEIIKPSSTGRINEVLIVIENQDWQGDNDEIGDALRANLAKNIVGFSQDEPTFNLSQIAPRNFNKILKPSRNIVKIIFGKEKSFKITKDKHATPQKIISITANTKKEMIAQITKNGDEMIAVFRKSDLKIYKKKLLTKYWDVNNINTFKNLNASIKMPYGYMKVYDTLNYIWFKKEIPQGSLNIQMYAVSITNQEDLNGENIIKNRNKKAKKYVVGTKGDMYMITEEAFTPLRFETTLAGKKTFETRGTWEMKNGFMAGPFLNYSVLDKKNNRILVVEGFVYAPNYKKRDYMFELEILLNTLQIE